ncbi:DoxX family protein [Phenylobacterium sp.]|uniref:DoxX family protein n=1 Tax=Phenylobacterium sp. TaxID=1871053 RepID=UPI00286D0D23|nr:DoxX family protein [Phenylobacterium sp.]
MVRLETSRMIFRVVLAAAYLVAGVAHLYLPAPFLSITPQWVPQPELVIAATGVAEILGATTLVAIPPLRRAAAICLALYAVCVYPANIKHAADAVSAHGLGAWWPYHAPRLAFQPVLVWWALFAGGITAWPFGGTKGDGASAGASGSRMARR